MHYKLLNKSFGKPAKTDCPKSCLKVEGTLFTLLAHQHKCATTWQESMWLGRWQHQEVLFAQLLSLLITSCWFSSVLQAGVRRHDVADEFFLDLAAEPAFDAVGKLSWSESESSFNATGTLISPRWVLTAARIVDGENGLGAGIENLSFDVGGNSFAADQWIPHPDWQTSGFDNLVGWDIGLVKLAQPIHDVAPIPTFSSGTESEIGFVGLSAGFGQTGTGLTGATINDGLKRGGTNVIDTISSFAFLPPFDQVNHNRLLLADFDNPASFTDSSLGSFFPLSLEYLPATDDGGSPLLVFNSADELQIAGVFSFVTAPDGTADADYGDVAAFARVLTLTSFLESTTGLNLSETNLLGDFNHDDTVDGADYSLWESQFGRDLDGLAVDADGSSIVDIADYTIWRDSLPAANLSAPGNRIPEPDSSVALLLVVATVVVFFKQKLVARRSLSKLWGEPGNVECRAF